jgi:hypothetical protein
MLGRDEQMTMPYFGRAVTQTLMNLTFDLTAPFTPEEVRSTDIRHKEPWHRNSIFVGALEFPFIVTITNLDHKQALSIYLGHRKFSHQIKG